MDWFFSKPVFPNLEFTTGLPTASFTFLDRGQIASVNYYDIRNRVIQTRAQNHAGGYDHYTNEYGGLTQRIVMTQHAHSTTFNLESYDFSEEIRFVYDGAGRLVSKDYRFDNSLPVQVITNSYDALGRLKSKQIGDENYLLQTVDYTYNMRGWLTKINNPGEVSLNGDFFGEEIFYDIPDNSLSNIGNSRLFNGNISGIKWQSVRPTGVEGPTTTGLKAYVYDYDNLNRLTLGSYLEVEQGSWVSNAKYTESIGPYDLNGNIKSLRRRGICVVNNSPDFLDLLTYTYNGNQVIAVDDEIAVNNTDDFYDNGHYYSQTQEAEYRYDGNGNLISDLNKNIIEINYNYLNLPVSFSKRGDNRVEYDYSPQGSKLTQRYLRDGALVKTTDFVANFVYEDGVPAWVIYDEGRVVFDLKGGVFPEAFLKDHLGNVRVAIRRSSGQTTIRQTDSYYPFGMTIRDLSRNGTDVIHKNEYLYNGKMHQDEMGLNLLDYGARFYDPVLCRWHSVDPAIENNHFDYTPFAYVYNNPLKYIDLFGADTSFANDQDRKYVLQLIDKNNENYSKRFAKKFKKLANSEKMYNFQSFKYGDIKDNQGNNIGGKIEKDKNDHNTMNVYFTKGDSKLNQDRRTGLSEFSTLFEETYHAWDYETGGLDINNPTATDEAQAWKFAVTAPGTQYTIDITTEGGKTYTDYTAAYSIKNATTGQVAAWFKYGMPSKIVGGKEYYTVNKKFDLINPIGLYSDKPLK